MWNNFTAFMAQPFKSDDMDAFDWFMFVGFILTLLILWAIILKHVREAV